MRRSSVRSPEPLLTCRLVSRRGAEDPSRAAAAHARGGGAHAQARASCRGGCPATPRANGHFCGEKRRRPWGSGGAEGERGQGPAAVSYGGNLLHKTCPARARLGSSPRRTPGCRGRVLPRWPCARRAAFAGRPAARPGPCGPGTPHPGARKPRPLTLRAGSGSGGRRRGGAAYPGSPHRFTSAGVWGRTGVVP